MTPANQLFSHAASAVSRWAGRPMTFLACILIVLIWAISGPVFGFSDTWQLVINTGTTIITFLMVFLIQNTQNRDNAAIQAKLDELIRTSKAKNSFIGIEHLSDSELEDILAECERHRPHVIDRAEARVASEKAAAAVHTPTKTKVASAKQSQPRARKPKPGS